MILKTIISEIAFSDINFYVSSMNVVIVIIKPLTRFNFHNFIFLIIKNVLIKIIKKTSSYLYSKNVSSLILRDKRINVIVIL